MSFANRLKFMKGPRAPTREGSSEPSSSDPDAPAVPEPTGSQPQPRLGSLATRLGRARVGCVPRRPEPCEPSPSPAVRRGTYLRLHDPREMHTTPESAATDAGRAPQDRAHVERCPTQPELHEPRRPPKNSRVALPGLGRRVTSWGVAERTRWPEPLRASPASARLPTLESVARALASLGESDDATRTPSQIAVLDLETSGGWIPGPTMAFIVGVAWYPAPHEVQVRQWTLARAEDEAPMLEELRALFDGPLRHATLVTFNGARFDVPVLGARLQRCGLDPRPLSDRPHLDLLGPARRLWSQALGTSRLTALEREILGLQRVGDVDGADIAALFPRLTRDPDSPVLRAELESAAAHNQADLLSLLALAVVAARRLHEPTSCHEATAVARDWARRGRLEIGWRKLQPFVEVEPSLPALLLGAELLRRLDRRHEGARLLWRILERSPGHVEAHEALAIYLEHHAGRLEEALRVAETSKLPCPRRIDRLRRKISARAASARDARVDEGGMGAGSLLPPPQN